MKLQLLSAAALCATLPCRGADSAEMPDVIRRYTADHHVVARAYELPWSQTRFDRFEKLYRDWQGQEAALDFDSLNQDGRLDYILLRNELAAELNQQTLQRERLKEMEELLSFRSAIQELETARWRMEPLNAQAAATKVSELAERVKKLKERVEKRR